MAAARRSIFEIEWLPSGVRKREPSSAWDRGIGVQTCLHGGLGGLGADAPT